LTPVQRQRRQAANQLGGELTHAAQQGRQPYITSAPQMPPHLIDEVPDVTAQAPRLADTPPASTLRIGRNWRGEPVAVVLHAEHWSLVLRPHPGHPGQPTASPNGPASVGCGSTWAGSTRNGADGYAASIGCQTPRRDTAAPFNTERSTLVRNDHTNPSPTQSPADDPTPTEVWTEQRIRALGAITDLPTAGRIFGLGRAMSYELARTGQFPVPIIRVGARYKVPVTGILAALGLPATSGDLTRTPMRSVDHHHEISSPNGLHTDPDNQR
jgi:hypothetical protein